MNRAQKFWDKQAKRFDDNEKQFEQASRELIARTKEYFDANDNVLDFGCATGNKTLKLAEGIKHIHGLDFSAEMISEALKKQEKLNLSNVTFSQGTIFDNDLAESSFEKITAYSIIHLVEDCEKVIQRIHQLLKPGGLFISETACFKEKLEFKTRIEVTTYIFMRHLGVFPLNLNNFKTSELEQLIESHNFKIIKSENIFYNGMTISFIVAEKL